MNRSWKMWIALNDSIPSEISDECDKFVDWCQNVASTDDLVASFEVTVPAFVPDSEVEKYAEMNLESQAFRENWEPFSATYFIVEN